MKRAEEIGFATFLVIVFAVFVVFGLGFAWRPRIVPLTLSIPGLALSLLYLGNSIAKAKRSPERRQISRPLETTETSGGYQIPFLSGETRKIFEVWVWIIALAVGINFFGFLIGLPLFLLAFVRFFAKRTWKLGALIAASFTLAVYLLFYVGLKTTL